MSLKAPDIQARLEAKFPGKIVEAKLDAIDPFLVVDQGALLEMGRYLRDDSELAFDTLHCLSAVDYLKENRQAVKDFLKATRQGFTDWKAAPDTGATLAATKYGTDAGLKEADEKREPKQ